MSLTDDLVQIKRGNVRLKVPRDEAERYYSQGYDIVDKSGKVLKTSVPNDLGTLQKAFIDNAARIKELEAENKRLNAELAKVKKAGSKKETT